MAITKVFRIELQGGKDVQKDFTDLKKVIATLGAAIRAAKGELADLLNTKGDPKAIEEVKNRLQELEKQILATQKAYKSAKAAADQEAHAQKLLSDELIRQAKVRQADANAIKAEEQAKKAKLATDKAEESQSRKTRQANEALAGSYNEIKNQLGQLRSFVQSGGFGGTIGFNGQNINFDQAIEEFKRLSFAEQDFRRQFAKDGTIVGEYATGVVNAFNRLGIDDIIKNQVDGAKKELSSLEQRTKDLVTAYRAAQQSGGADMNKLEKEIHDNVLETQKLQQAIQRTETQLKGMGGVGSQISASLTKGFKGLVTTMTQFAIGFVGFQAAVGAVRNLFEQTIALDSLDASLKLVSGSEEELIKNQQFLTEVTQRLGLEYTQTAVAFKNFYAASTQAGISAEETRKIFEAATEATAGLKLSQEDTNGVLLAFGQIASKGKVQAEELRGQIGERIPGAFSIAARAIGVTQAELNKMLQQGQVMSDTFLPKFAAELKKTFGNSGEEVEGLQANINRLKNTFTKFVQDNQKGLTTFFNNLVKLAAGFAALAAVIVSFPFPVFIGSLLTIIALTNTWIGAKIRLATAFALETAALFIQNAQLVVTNTITAIATTVTNVYTVAILRSATATGLAAVGFRIMAATIAFLTSPLAIVIGLVVAFTTVLGILSAKGVETRKNIEDIAKAQRVLAATQKVNAELNERVTRTTSDQIAELNKLSKIATSANVSLADRKKALADLIAINPEYLKGLTLENVATDAGRKILDTYIESLKKAAKAKAIVALIDEKEREKLITEGKKNNLVGENATFQTDTSGKVVGESIRNKNNIGTVVKAIGKDLFGFGTGTTTQQLSDLTTSVGKTNDELDVLYKLLAENNLTTDKIKDIPETVVNKGGKVKVDKLSAELQNAFKDIDAIRDQELADEAIYFENKFESESDYIKQVRDINIDAINYKLKLLDGSNAEERKRISEFNLEKITLTKEANKKLFELENKQLEIALRNATLNAQLIQEAQQLDPELTEVGKLAVEKEFLNSQLEAQILFNQQQILLEKKYSIESIENEQKRKEAIEKLNKELRENLAAIPAARILDVRADGQQRLSGNDIATSDRTVSILGNGESTRKQAKQLKELEEKAAIERLKIERDTAAEIVAIKAEQYAQQLISEKEYQEALAELKGKEAALYQFTVDKQLTSTQKLIKALKGVKDAFLENVFGIQQYSDTAEGERAKQEAAIKAGLDGVKEAIKTAYDSYFKNEADKIEKSKEVQLGFLEREKERVLATAQSEAEKDAIERKFAQKRKEEERKAFEEKKKLAVKQATIDFALASIKSFAEFGWPLGLVAVGGLTVAYLAQLASINSQSFAKGGQVQPESGGNGKITAAPNIPTQKNGDRVLATVMPGEVILNKQQQRALGGPRTFQQLGVPGFASGGAVGATLKAPQFTASNYTGVTQAATQGEERMERLEALTKQVLTAVYYSDAKPVVLNTRAVTKAQDRTQKDVSLGTI